MPISGCTPRLLVTGNTCTHCLALAHLNGDIPHNHKNVKGYVRAFDAHTGKRKWIFHTIPRKGEFGYDTWIEAGQAEQAGNTGSLGLQMSADPERGAAERFRSSCLPAITTASSAKVPACSARRWWRWIWKLASANGITSLSITVFGIAIFPAPRCFAIFR